MYCDACQREVVLYTVSLGAASKQELDRLRETHREAGRWVLFNPPPVEPYRCPRCRGPLRRKKEE